MGNLNFNGYQIIYLFVFISFLVFLIANWVIYSFGDRIYYFFYNIFIPKIKILKGKIIRLKSRKFFVAVNQTMDNNINLIQNMSNFEQPITIIGYFAFFEEEINHQKYFIEISKKSFEELQRKEISSLKNISLSFKKWFWGNTFDHFEIA